MSELLKKIGAFLFEEVKKVEWKPILYSAYHKSVKDKLQKKVESNDAENVKWDNMVFEAVNLLIETFLKPDAPVAAK